jgi:formylglycine-generating enzyme required for sulfatase activity
MTTPNELSARSQQTEILLASPFEWCHITGGVVNLIDASDYGGNKGGTYQVADFAMAKYLITNSQYQKFLDHPNGFKNAEWWDYSPEGTLWRRDHRKPKPTAFAGADLSRTRISWFDGVAFCNWLSAELKTHRVRLPTEQEWQRAAVGDTDWYYPWGNELDDTRANYANQVGQVAEVGKYPNGQSPFGVVDMIGNLWEWNLTIWGTDRTDLEGYVYRNYRGGAWNVSNPEYLRAIDRGVGHSPRGQLNDAGLRIILQLSGSKA